MKEATLFDSTINLRHDLAALVEKNGSAVSLGRGERADIVVGKNSKNSHLPKVSRKHSLIVYDAATDKFTYIDAPAQNHSRIKRKGGWIFVDDLHPREVLESGDQIYLSKSFSAGYGPLIFYQGEDCRELHDNDGTQRID